MEIQSTQASNQARTVNASRGSDEERQQARTDAERISSRRHNNELAQARSNRQREQDAHAQTARDERRMQGRMVTDARRETARRADDAAQTRAMRAKVEGSYLRDQQRVHRESVRSEADHRQTTRDNRAIDLVV